MKNSKKILWSALVLVMLLGGGFFVFSLSRSMQKSYPETVVIGGERFTLEIAQSDRARALGLGERDSLCETCAMLFVFDEPDQYSFWMKGMRFPLDIIWLSGDRVVHIEKNIPSASTAFFTPEEKADTVIEVNAGKAANLQVGEKVQFSYE